uniref:Heat shock protein 70 n=1 Tax=Panagrolaimus davidi TaxID=227884 RepID=A0A914QB29_9BILA
MPVAKAIGISAGGLRSTVRFFGPVRVALIGIDLGTTNSCVGVFHNGEVQIISNILSKRTTPSIVGFVEGLKLVGKYAKEQMPKHPSNVIFCIKRLIGRKFDDPKVQEDIKNLPYKVVSKKGNAAVEVQVCGKTKVFTPEQICALILKDLMVTANKFLPYDVKDAVITIPAYFNDSQRQATIDAAKIAGLNVLRTINEPTAAALAYGFKQKWKKGIILVYDLGGGTFDVSIIKVTNGCCEVLAVDGDDHLGGEDFDNLLVRHCIGRFEHDISNNAKAICKLKAACEDAKRLLSESSKALIEVDELCNGDDFSCKITQGEFNELCKELIEKTVELVKNVLEKAKLSKNDITNVLLVGGSTRIPLIEKMLKEFFDHKNLNFDINPDEAVANGATILAAHLSSSCFDTSIQNIKLLDVIPRSLGTDLYTNSKDENGYYEIVAKRGTKFPFEMKTGCTTLYTNQEEMHFVVYEGEDPVVKKNKELGRFILTNIAPARGGIPRIEITFKVDENAILTVTAADKRNGISESIVIRRNNGRLSDDEIVEMVHDIQLSNEDIVID